MANRKKGKLRNCLWPFYREGIVNFSQFRPEAYIMWVEPTLEMAGCEKLAWLSWEKPLLHLWRLMEVCISCRDVSFIFFFFLLFNYKISVSIKKYFLNCLNIIGLDFFQTFKYLVYKRDYDFYLIFKYNSYKILLIYHYPINIYFYNKR